MALATQCPHCHTTFRVAHDQLKLRAGLVRCGACKQIFNGIENLLRPDDTEQARPAPAMPSPPPPPAPPIPEPVEAAPATPEPIAQEATFDEPTAAESLAAAPEALDHAATDDPLLRMTLVNLAPPRQQHAAEEAEAEPDARADDPDRLARTIDALERKPWRSATPEAEQSETDELDRADAREYVEPSFVTQGRRRQRIGRAVRLLMACALPLLMLALLAQGIYMFRDQLAARFPQAKPALLKACNLVGCQLGLPAQIESVAIESSELQMAAADRNIFSLSVLLRNQGATVQAWPSIELTLNDANEAPIARRIFLPRDYLPAPQDIDKGFAAKSEQPVKLFFELQQLQASGYRVYLFYP